MASPLEIMLSKFHWPRANHAQTHVVDPSQPAVLAEPSTDMLTWDQHHDRSKPDAEQPEVPQAVIDQVTKARQDVLAMFDFAPSHSVKSHAALDQIFADNYKDRVAQRGPTFMFAEKQGPIVKALITDLNADLKTLKEQRDAEADPAKKTKLHITWMQTMAFKHLMDGREGPTSAINTYDKAAVTWGMGWAYPGGLPKVLRAIVDREKVSSKQDPDRMYVQKFFSLCGFMFDGARFYVVNTADRRVYSGTPAAHTLALWTIHEERALHAMWVVAARDDLTRRTIFEAQRDVFFSGNGTIALAEKLATGALYTFLSHLQHWTGDLTFSFVQNALLSKRLEGVAVPSQEADAIIAECAVRRFYCRRVPDKESNNFEQTRDYWHQMVGIDTQEEGLTSFKPSLPFMDWPPVSSLDAIPSNHVAAKVDAKFYDLGPPEPFKKGDPANTSSPGRDHMLGKGPASTDAGPPPEEFVGPPPMDEFVGPPMPMIGPPLPPREEEAASAPPPPPKESVVDWIWKKLHIGCFPAGTPVALPEGRTRAIDELQVGDAVLAYHEATREVVVATVRRCWHKPATHFVRLSVGASSEPLRVTPSHPFFSAGEWRPAGELRAGDAVEVLDGARTRTVLLADVQLVEREPEPVYTLTVDPTPTFFAGGVLVHNKHD